MRARGLRAEDIDVLPGASGGAKWLVLAGLDRYLFGTWLRPRLAPGQRPLHGVGSSIGSWRLACLAQRDPVEALARGHDAYVFHQQYPPNPSVAQITTVLRGCLDYLVGPDGVAEAMAHPTLRLHVITARGRGLTASTARAPLALGLGLAALTNALHRRTLALHFTRTVFHAHGEAFPFGAWRDVPTVHRALTRTNLRDVLLASGSIPLVMDGVRLAEEPRALYWDGGVTDYHLDIDHGPGEGLVLYPHFYPHVVPGWFDKGLAWRRATAARFDRTLLIAPSAAFVASLPGGKIPDRKDFYTMTDRERQARWQTVRAASEQLAEELHELIETGRLVDRVEPWM